MNKQKQVQEIAEVVSKVQYLGGLETTVAARIYDAGYRKQVEGQNISKMHPVDEFICEKCGAIFRDTALVVIDEEYNDETYYEFEFGFCPRCGMKVVSE